MNLRITTWLFLSLAALALGATAMVLSASTPAVSHSTPPVELPAASATVAESATKATAGPPPRIVVEKTEFDFGNIDVGQKGSHAFTIRNAGEGPLTLQCGETSCKCTRCDAGDGMVPPGEARQVTIGWETTEATEGFRHGAKIETNDPAQPQISLVVSGRVRTHLAASPATLVLSDVHKDAPRTATMLVYSQAWDGFEITSCMPSFEQLSCQIEPASAESLEKLNARSGYELQVTLAPGLKPGKFSGQLMLEVQPSNDKVNDESKEPVSPKRRMSIQVQGNVQSNVSVFGAGLEGVIGSGRLPLGTLSYGEGVKKTIAIMARGEQRELTVRELSVKPDFVQVRFERDPASSGQTTRYRLHIEVPETAPPGTYRGAKRGEILLRTDHPDLDAMRLHIEFTIAPPVTR